MGPLLLLFHPVEQEGRQPMELSAHPQPIRVYLQHCEISSRPFHPRSEKIDGSCPQTLNIPRNFTPPFPKALYTLQMSNFTVFSNLITTYPTWADLSAFLTSAAGGSLRVDDRSSVTNPYALIRYVKGKSNLALPHVRAFRSVVWDVLENRPVSVTPFKSQDGETLPTATELPLDKYRIQEFVDGVMIGMFWDKYSSSWRIHTRSMLDAGCRYYSQTKTFKQLFDDANADFSTLLINTGMSYTFVLQHPENRIVTPTKGPVLYCVQQTHVNAEGTVTTMEPAPSVFTCANVLAPKSYILQTPNDIWSKIAMLNLEVPTAQGLVIKDLLTGDRYKVRTLIYNTIRQMRGNSPRRDYTWLTLWRNNTLRDYTIMYPEERMEAEGLVNKWKAVTNSVFHIYTDVFKARSMNKADIPPKFRPLVYGLHNLYMESLKPAQKSVDWKTTLAYMNARDVAQMLFVINWDIREAAKANSTPAIPLEPSSTVGTDINEALSSHPKTDDMAVDIPNA